MTVKRESATGVTLVLVVMVMSLVAGVLTVLAVRVGNFYRAEQADRAVAVARALGELMSLEGGKIVEEARGEVQEWIDVCDFALGLSRQLYGLTIASERPRHRMMEQWHPLGPVGVISAFNFPVAVWAWNAMLAFVCGDSVVWKPSEKTPLCAFACHEVVQEALNDFPEFPREISSILVFFVLVLVFVLLQVLLLLQVGLKNLKHFF